MPFMECYVLDGQLLMSWLRGQRGHLERQLVVPGAPQIANGTQHAPLLLAEWPWRIWSPSHPYTRTIQWVSDYPTLLKDLHWTPIGWSRYIYILYNISALDFKGH